MSAEIFDFPFHDVQNIHPEGASVQFGSNWVFTAKPDAPPKRRFNLAFPPGMQYFIVPTLNAARGDLKTPEGYILSGQKPRSDTTVLPTSNETIGQRNILALEDFYVRHAQWDTFMYPHVIRGLIKVRFSSQFTMPQRISQNGTIASSFTMQLEEMF